MPYVEVATIVLIYPAAAVGRRLDATGFLVPPAEGRLLVGCSWLSAKWPRLSSESVVVLRAMVGRAGDERAASLDDATLIRRVHAELAEAMGLSAEPLHTHLQRWPRALPQYTVGHQERLNRLDVALAKVPGLHVTGAAYRGAGVAGCIAQAKETAALTLASLDGHGPNPDGATMSSTLAVPAPVRPPVDFATRPMLVFWETTRACQLACRHCRASATPQALPGELTEREGRQLIDQVAAFGRPHPILVLTGGDCLLRPDLFELINHAVSLGIPVALSPSVTPLLTPQMITRIAGSGVKAVSISLDGARAALTTRCAAYPVTSTRRSKRSETWPRLA